MGDIPVDFIMSKPVYFVNDSDTVKKAYDIMKDKGTKKILVKDKNQKPIGVLEAWKITSKDYDKKVNQITLGKIELMPQDVDIGAVEKALTFVSAVYIIDQTSNIIGVVTAYDMYKSAA